MSSVDGVPADQHSRRQAVVGGPLARVRAATAHAHQQLDVSLQIAQRPWDRRLHGQWLALTWGLLAPLEQDLAAWAATDSAALDVADRARADLALADLRVLAAHLPDGTDGSDGAVQPLPQCPDVPRCTTRAAALGVCYVLDGSTLGGRLITKAAVAAGVPPQACTSLTGREGAGRRWRQTMAAVNTIGEQGVPEMTTAAVATFAAYQRWLAPLLHARR